MSYQALYRVWRPQRFQDIAGQRAITQTLRNALIQGKSSHAYLFTGPRGTGKTSAAKIFAKAINCHFLENGEPCNECESCKAITSGQLNDVIEIDAASNNGVEEIRDIRDKAKYAPTSADYKVYIIDEVHMLSTGAFNALLKTLEEPPKNVIFILATTEPHKIPLTIISRTQRFDFKRISVKDICERMVYILNQEKIGFEDAALPVIARVAEGGMRDALSILDQVISYGDDMVTLANAMSVTGSLTQELLLNYFDAILTHNTEQGLSLLQSILAEGKDAARFVEDLILFSRDLLVYQQAPQMIELLEEASADSSFKELSEKMPAESLYQVITILNETQSEMRFSNHPDIYLEVATVKMTQLRGTTGVTAVVSEMPIPVHTANSVQSQPSSNGDVSQLEAEMQALKKQLQEMKEQGIGTAVKKAPAKVVQKKANGGQFKPNTTAIYSVLKEATKDNLLQLRDLWPDLLNMLSVTQRAIMKASTPVAASPSGLIVSFEYDILCQKATNDTELSEAISEYMRRLIGHTPTMICVPSEQWPTIRTQYLSQNKAASSPSEESPASPAMNQGSATGTQGTKPVTESNSTKPEPQQSQQAEFTNVPSPFDGLDDFAAPPEENPEDNSIVSEAMQLFGESIVEVIND
ncbi:DNA polymerase III subunit gamma/tau [Carnobacterium gallinarum]|uniref:DNA polymerase III subunit gamma/tau n=1 Tax=Carnobacterium gallinarum TaxID=2749 RepID=UPI000556B483|nr:DNA polymerase III subunit gamma/tau [Carnobacterium gallinarum]